MTGLAFAFVWLAAAQNPTDSADALEKLKTFARNYGASLQDFTCDKHTIRKESRVPGTKWKQVDSYAEQINHVNHAESRKLIRVNGQTGLKRSATRVGGEFALLGRIFQEKSKAEFLFDHREGEVCIFQYHVDVSTAPFTIQMGREPIHLGHGGRVYSLCDTGVVTRLDAASDLEPDKGIEMKTSIRFGPATIGGKEFQMPQSAEDLSRVGKNLTRAEVTFRDYRKYEATSEIQFETGSPIP